MIGGPPGELTSSLETFAASRGEEEIPGHTDACGNSPERAATQERERARETAREMVGSATRRSSGGVAEQELQRLKMRLEPIVITPEPATLHDAYVPRGDVTLSPVDAESSTLAPDEPDIVEVGANRYSGVIYAARFLVTRVGFLRSVKRCVVKR
jgi:hypothetical protein